LRKFVLRRWNAVPNLSSELMEQLRLIPKNVEGAYPVAVTLKDGLKFPCVLLFEIGSEAQARYIPRFGLLRIFYKYELDRMIDPVSILSIDPSDYRIPPTIEEKMKSIRAWGMGDGITIRFKMKDEKEFIYEGIGQDSRTFISPPSGYSNDMIIDATTGLQEEVDSFEISGKRIYDHPFRLCMFRNT